MNDQLSHDAGADDTASALAAEALARFYDDTAAATGWLGPQVAFDLIRDHLKPGQTLLDLGIGTGLSSALFREAGLRVHGLDGDPEMLAVCRWKGFGDLVLHDLAQAPYPFPSASFDHAVCLGVLPFLADPEPVFSEAARVLRPGGMFAVLSLDRPPAEPRELLVPAGEAGGEGATLFRSSAAEVRELAERHGFSAAAEVPVLVYQDAARTRRMPATCYLCLRNNR